MKYCRCERPEYGHSEYCPMVRIEELEADLKRWYDKEKVRDRKILKYEALIDRAIKVLSMFRDKPHLRAVEQDMRKEREVK